MINIIELKGAEVLANCDTQIETQKAMFYLQQQDTEEKENV